ncbi:hypothetical protein H4R34_001260 [Dimargaris verticillata]|uniref:DASH complex subunit ASK1 n=1 Tax=Dimargaris verticillata TaxID=2761393 RepID=A0A9W8BA82_9FUNG|nr:hypothetical protein H4R34_001260 [Dimargaris verticillata]
MRSLPLNSDIPFESLDPHAQLELLEQNITYLLQEIDANFAVTHRNLESELLPRVEKLGHSSKRLLEICKPWLQFFELFATPNAGEPASSDWANESANSFAYPLGEPLPSDTGYGQLPRTPGSARSRLSQSIKLLQLPVVSPSFRSVRGLIQQTTSSQQSPGLSSRSDAKAHSSAWPPSAARTDDDDESTTATLTKTSDACLNYGPMLTPSKPEGRYASTLGDTVSTFRSHATAGQYASGLTPMSTANHSYFDTSSLASTPSEIRRFIQEKTPRALHHSRSVQPPPDDPFSPSPGPSTRAANDTPRTSTELVAPSESLGWSPDTSALMKRYTSHTSPAGLPIDAAFADVPAGNQPLDAASSLCSPATNNYSARTHRRLSGLTREIEALLEDDPDETVLLSQLTRKYDTTVTSLPMLSENDGESENDDSGVLGGGNHDAQDETDIFASSPMHMDPAHTTADTSLRAPTTFTTTASPSERAWRPRQPSSIPGAGHGDLASFIGDDTVQVAFNSESPCAPKSIRWSQPQARAASQNTTPP